MCEPSWIGSNESDYLNCGECSSCVNVGEETESDSDRVLNWYCMLHAKDVEPDDCCEDYDKYVEDFEIDEDELY